MSAPSHQQAASQSDDTQLPASVATFSTIAIDPDGLEAYFTDVEHLRNAFGQMVSAPVLPKRLLVIHGVGGAGKSSLLRMFRIHTRRAGVPIALASGDEVKSVVDLLAGWSEDPQAAGVRLPTIAKTIARYRGVQTTVERQAQKATTVAGKLAVKTAEGVAGSMAGAAIGSLFPVIGTVAGAAVGALVGTGGEALSDWLGSFLKRPDIDLLLDPTRQLTDAFLTDIDKAAAQQRIVLLLDTFEQLSALEDWARDLAQRLRPNVLLVIAGRALPGWGRTWPGWLAQARVEELKPMTPEIMRELIGRYYMTMRGGRPDSTQVEAIIHFARGLPVVVTSAVQLWVAYGVEDFQSVKTQVVADLVDRLLEGVPRELVPKLEAAATLRWFNKEVLRAVLQQNDVNAVYDELRRFPFIRPRVEGLALHDAVREIVDENLRVNDPERHRALHECAAAYFEEQLAQGSGQATERLGLERLYHRVRADEDGGIRLFREMAEELRRHRRANTMRILLNDISSYLLEYENSRLWRSYYNARLVHLNGQLKDAAKVYRDIAKSNRAEPKLRAYALCEWGYTLSTAEWSEKSGDLQEALQVAQESLQLVPQLDDKLIVNYHTFSRVYRKQGNWEAAEDSLEKIRVFSQESNNTYGVASACRKLRDLYFQRGLWHKGILAQHDGMKILPKDSLSSIRFQLLGIAQSGLIWAGHYSEVERNVSESISIRERIGNLDKGSSRDKGLAVGMQGRYVDANQIFEAILNSSEERSILSAVTLNFQGIILLRQGKVQESEACLSRALAIKQGHADNYGIPDILTWLGQLCEVRSEWEDAERDYRYTRDLKTGRLYFESAALTGLVRVKHAQGDYDAIPALLAEAEALAQQYEYNDHLASLRLSQAQLAWDGLLPTLGRGFDAALGYYKQALIYALRYNRFLLDEALWGGGVSTPLKPIIPHCVERTFEGQRMLVALRDWWQSGSNGIGTPRPDTISPIPEGIALLEAERVARQREPGDGMPQQWVVDAIDDMLK
jgi:tetratricopeptide (TPR) repeat protein